MAVALKGLAKAEGALLEGPGGVGEGCAAGALWVLVGWVSW